MAAPLFLNDTAWQRYEAILRSWLGTPYRHLTMVKGRGADCALFIGASLVEAGILDKVIYEYYPCDWHIHTHEEVVLEGLFRHFSVHVAPGLALVRLERDTALLRGDILAFATTLTGVANHAAVFLGERMIHAAPRRGVSLWSFSSYFERHLAAVFRIMEGAWSSR